MTVNDPAGNNNASATVGSGGVNANVGGSNGGSVSVGNPNGANTNGAKVKFYSHTVAHS